MSQKHDKQEHSSLILATDPGVSRTITDVDEAAQQLGMYLSERIGATVHIRLSQHYEEMLAGLERGEIDAAKLGPYAFALAQARSGVHALVNLQEITSTSSPDATLQPPYRSIICTRADSGITHIEQLRGQRFGFVDPNSTTGYLVATFLLQQAGLDTERDIQTVFLQSHKAVAEAILRGEVVAGAIMETEFLRQNETAQSPMSLDSNHSLPPLRLLAASPLLARGPVVVRQGLSGHLERKLLTALVQLHNDNPECATLLKLPTQRFVPAVQRERTLKMVAELAGVSYATVSRAINGRDRIAPETTARILKLVDELGYRPNANARSLHKSKGDLIGLLLPSLNYPNIDDIVTGIQEMLDEVDMRLLVCPVGNEASRHEAYFEMITNSRFEGVLLTQWSAAHPAAINVARSGHPSVLLEQDVLERGLPTAWKWLREQGHHDIALVMSAASWLEPVSTNRMCAQSNVQCIELSTQTGAWLHELQRITPKPTALVCAGVQTALIVRQELKTSGIDAFVMSIGDSSLAHWTNLPVLTFDGVKLGRRVTQRLLRMMNMSVASQERDVEFWVRSEIKA